MTPRRTGPPGSGRADDGGAADKHCSCGLDAQFGTVKQMRRGKCLLVLKMIHKTSRNACWHRCEFLLRCRWGLSRGSTFRRPACRFRVAFFCAVVAERIMGHFSPSRWFERGEFLTNGRLNILLALISCALSSQIRMQTSRFATMHGVYSSFSCSAIFYGDCVQRGSFA